MSFFDFKDWEENVSLKELKNDPFWLKISEIEDPVRKESQKLELYEYLIAMKKAFPSGKIPTLYELESEEKQINKEIFKLKQKSEESEDELLLLLEYLKNEEDSFEKRLFKRQRLAYNFKNKKLKVDELEVRRKLLGEQSNVLVKYKDINIDRRAFLTYMHRFSNIPPDTEKIVADFLGVRTTCPQDYKANFAWKWPQEETINAADTLLSIKPEYSFARIPPNKYLKYFKYFKYTTDFKWLLQNININLRLEFEWDTMLTSVMVNKKHLFSFHKKGDETYLRLYSKELDKGKNLFNLDKIILYLSDMDFVWDDSIDSRSDEFKSYSLVLS